MSTPLTALLQSLRFAADKHRDQRRKGVHASPYINHPIEVATLLAEVGGITDIDVLRAAILHDTIEDTDTTGAELEEVFGARVRGFVEEVTDDKNLPKAVRKQLQIDHAPHLTAGGTAIKLADKICNVADIGVSSPKGWSQERQLTYLDWAQSVVDAGVERHEALESAFEQAVVEARRAVLARA
jgi:(p)ppGpp synthase/HD superfamily hydrolase